MPTYIGFGTQHINQVQSTYSPGVSGGVGIVNNIVNSNNKSYKLVDEQTIIQSLINAFNIPQGQKPGKPEYGTTLWSFVFEPNVLQVQIELEKEIRRVASLDSRLILNSIVASPHEDGISVEIELAIVPFNIPRVVNVFFDQNSNSAFSS
jgi:phage baseplate assembly protein W